MADEIRDAIIENASGPKKAVSDGVTVEQHSLQDQIAADQYTKACEAAKKPRRGLSFMRFVPPGA